MLLSQDFNFLINSSVLSDSVSSLELSEIVLLSCGMYGNSTELQFCLFLVATERLHKIVII